jgi:hypothetical protein
VRAILEDGVRLVESEQVGQVETCRVQGDQIEAQDLVGGRGSLRDCWLSMRGVLDEEKGVTAGRRTIAAISP